MSAFGEQVTTIRRQEQVQQALETCTDDMEKWVSSTQLTALKKSASSHAPYEGSADCTRGDSYRAVQGSKTLNDVGYEKSSHLSFLLLSSR